MAEVIYSESKEVQTIIEEFISKVDRFQFISKEDIVGMMMSKETSRFNACIFRMPKKVWPLLQGPYKLGVIVWKERWDGLKQDAKYLLIYHELLHAVPGKKEKYSLVRHDVEDFKEILQKAGLNWEKPEYVFEMLNKKAEVKPVEGATDEGK